MKKEETAKAREACEAVLKGDPVDICIDDGFHSVESILTTMRSVLPYLAETFIYFIEDNKAVHREIRMTYPDFTIDSSGELTIVTRNAT